MDPKPRKRKITNRGTKKQTGLFPSEKNEKTIEYESSIELDYFYLLEFDEDVVSYEEQPFSIHYLYLGRI